MKEHLAKLLNNSALLPAESEDVFELLMRGQEQNGPTDAQIGAYLYNTACRPIASPEIIGAAACLRRHMRKVALPAGVEAIDTCGTGGSGFETFNTSTAAALVCAGAGVTVAKHGNRAASSKSGSADVLQELGINLECSPEQIGSMLAKIKFGFMNAPLFHPATKRVAGIRRELGVRTIFNFLGPLVNPAGVTRQVLGVSSREMQPVLAEALSGLGCKHALVVRGDDGLDEISLTAPTTVYEIKDQDIRSYTITAPDFGFKTIEMSAISVKSPAESATALRELLSGKKNCLRELVLLNAAAGLLVSGVVGELQQGIAKAESSIDSGSARHVLEQAIALSHAD